MYWFDSILAQIYQRLFAAHTRSPEGQMERYRRLINHLDEMEFIATSVEHEVRLQLLTPPAKDIWIDCPNIIQLLEARESFAETIGTSGASVLGFEGRKPVIYCWLIEEQQLPEQVDGIPVIRTSYAQFCTYYAEAVRKLRRE